MRRVVSSGLLVVAALLAAGCTTPAWSYSDPTGPRRWGGLHKDWALARTGLSQSPIDIIQARPDGGGPLEVEYQPVPLRLTLEDHVIKLPCPYGGELNVGTLVWTLDELHFHTPGEHTVDGEPYAMECHLVHSNDKGQTAIVALLFEEGEANAFLEPWMDILPQLPGDTSTVHGARVDPGDLFPESLASWRYIGSLPRPPCTEGVRWIVLKEPLAASREQIDQLLQVTGANARPVQPLNDRFIRNVQ